MIGSEIGGGNLTNQGGDLRAIRRAPYDWPAQKSMTNDADAYGRAILVRFDALERRN
jgi:hypothetical protein